ncbi:MULTISPECIES: DUF2189 domain-containing protein [unclassified Roseitalea]|uniref:DUF2189 domain-containing protein n=1 Tax=unclassified Roseitalea TaxID=2639107 RepID=UPI00273D9C05|nr:MULTISPECIES: DUF2189 domain-containing protein [unclassified Roseitalea]
MSSTDSNHDADSGTAVSPASTMPAVNALTADDIRAALAEGWSDFRRAPLFGLFFAGVYAIGGLLIVQSLFVWEQSWMIYPVMIGFPLIGPFAAVGLYEVSRRLAAGEPLAWNEVLSVIRAQSRRELAFMAFVVLFIFWIWMYQVRLLIALVLGRMSFATWESFSSTVFTTSQGWTFLAIGHVVGAALALALFSVTVISIPMLLDRNVDFVTAMITSVKAVFASPVVMLGWGAIVTLAVIAGIIPAFLGLLVVLPVLGHTTWHIYKKAVQ